MQVGLVEPLIAEAGDSATEEVLVEQLEVVPQQLVVHSSAVYLRVAVKQQWVDARLVERQQVAVLRIDSAPGPKLLASHSQVALVHAVVVEVAV